MNLVSESQNSLFYQNNLDLDPMALILKLDLDIVKMYHHAKSEVSRSLHSKVIACTDTERDRQTHTHTHTHTDT